MSKVKTVGFAFFSPDGLRVIFMHKNYHVAIHTDADNLPQLSVTLRNLVIVPNVDRLADLAGVADKLHRVIVLARGKHEVLIKRGIPLVDAIVTDDDIEMVPTRTAERYCQAVENEAIEIDISEKSAPEFKPKPVVPPKPQPEEFEETPETLTQCIDEVAELWGTVVKLDFDRDFVEPAALFCVGELPVEDLKRSLQKLVKHGLSKDEAKNFFRWIKRYQNTVLDAAREAIGGESSLMDIASRYEIAIGDLQLLADVYQQQTT